MPILEKQYTAHSGMAYNIYMYVCMYVCIHTHVTLSVTLSNVTSPTKILN